MIKKDQCEIGVNVVVNNKVTKWNTEMNVPNNALMGFVFNAEGHSLCSGEVGINVGTQLELLGKPRRVHDSGVQIKFKIQGDETIYASWWICFKHKVDLYANVTQP